MEANGGSAGIKTRLERFDTLCFLDHYWQSGGSHAVSQLSQAPGLATSHTVQTGFCFSHRHGISQICTENLPRLNLFRKLKFATLQTYPCRLPHYPEP